MSNFLALGKPWTAYRCRYHAHTTLAGGRDQCLPKADSRVSPFQDDSHSTVLCRVRGERNAQRGQGAMSKRAGRTGGWGSLFRMGVMPSEPCHGTVLSHGPLAVRPTGSPCQNERALGDKEARCGFVGRSGVAGPFWDRENWVESSGPSAGPRISTTAGTADARKKKRHYPGDQRERKSRLTPFLSSRGYGVRRAERPIRQ